MNNTPTSPASKTDDESVCEPTALIPRNLSPRPTRSEKITDQHLQRQAIVYVRQSTQKQVFEHQESTARQYALTDRAYALGWPRPAIKVIDEDQGQSGSSAENRGGFQRLLTEISADRAGLILGLEMSRLARSCKDWHALLELCAIYRTLLADADGLYDPGDYNDRLLPGLKGTMSEAELHVLKSRLQQGMWNKAERGELLNHPPIGYVRSVSAREGAGDYVLDPDQQVQSVVRLIFTQFLRHGSINGLLRWLVREEVKIPVRPHSGPQRGELEWRRPNRVTLLNLLHHPIYAGACRWGHREIDARKKIAGRPTTGRTLKTHEECRVLIRDRFPAYIDWETFEQNQQKLRENSRLSQAMSAPKHGPGVLAGLVVCDRCGHRMLVSYAHARKDSQNQSLRYSCQREAIDYGGDLCQSLSGTVLEAFVIERLLQAVSPASLELSLAASADIEQEREQLVRHWQQRLTRSRYEVEQSRRQYAAVDPDHRLVARELERQWDQALRADEQLQADHARFLADRPRQLSAEEQQQIQQLSENLPQLWRSSSSTPEDRQSIARLMLEAVRINIEGDSERVEVELCWVGGFVSRHQLRRPVQTYEQLSYFEELMSRIKSLLAERNTLAAIATCLNEEGFQPPKRAAKFSAGILSRFLRDQGIRTGRLPKSVTEENHLTQNEYWLGELAAKLSMPIATLHRWQRVGRVTSRKVVAAGNRWAIFADAEELTRLQRLRASPRSWPTPYSAELTTPKPKPD